MRCSGGWRRFFFDFVIGAPILLEFVYMDIVDKAPVYVGGNDTYWITRNPFLLCLAGAGLWKERD